VAEETKPSSSDGPSFSGGKVIVACALFSLLVGIGLFLTIAQTKSGDPIPPDAAPHYYIHDAG
jgi:hypothetical protein